MNELFLNRMKDLLGDEYDSWIQQLNDNPRRGMRINTLKTDENEFFPLTGLPKEPTPFSDHGYYLPDEKGLGTTPAYLAGLFYIQEPSASAAVTILDVQPGERVLDLCAAPGSKTTQISEALGCSGFLAANEINAKRAGILLENVERHGSANVLVLNSDTSQVAAAFPEYFDKVLCDAPCSGEGMMRKNEEAVSQWSLQLVESCAARQKEILNNAYACLAGGGILVYSTCTFNREENEEVIQNFLKNHPDMAIDEPAVSFGRKAPVGSYGSAVRIFPMDGGEGHFICRMKKMSGRRNERKEMKGEHIDHDVLSFLKEQMEEVYPYLYARHGRVYGGLYPFIETGSCRIIRHQVYLGETKGRRFEPSYAFFMSAYGKLQHTLELSEEEVSAYLHGQQLFHPAEKGWHGVCWHGHALGGVHSDGKALKNKYPKQYRLR
jgi:NOL1/NOP2/sun family putative RNA methylase